MEGWQDIPGKRFGKLFPKKVDRHSCLICGESLSTENIHSEAGWREASISNTCEDCFEKMFEECEPE